MFRLKKSSSAATIPAPLKTVVSKFTKSRQIPGKVLQKVCVVAIDYAKNTGFANDVRNVEFERPFGAISTP